MNIAKNIILISPDELKPYEKNARVHSPEQIEKIKNSIKEFGFVNPLLVSAKHGVIAGHGRLEAAKKLGLDFVPVIILDHLSDAQQRALVLADNRISEDARWNYDLLKAELIDLEHFDFDLNSIGFSDSELDNLLPELDDEDVPKPATKINQISTSNSEVENNTADTSKKEVVGAKEYSEDQFQNFAHTCPRCSFEFN